MNNLVTVVCIVAAYTLGRRNGEKRIRGQQATVGIIFDESGITIRNNRIIRTPDANVSSCTFAWEKHNGTD